MGLVYLLPAKCHSTPRNPLRIILILLLLPILILNLITVTVQNSRCLVLSGTVACVRTGKQPGKQRQDTDSDWRVRDSECDSVIVAVMVIVIETVIEIVTVNSDSNNKGRSDCDSDSESDCDCDTVVIVNSNVLFSSLIPLIISVCWWESWSPQEINHPRDLSSINVFLDVDSNRDRDQEEELVNRALDLRAEGAAAGVGGGESEEVRRPSIPSPLMCKV